jgi:hypothetical protein
MASAMSAAEARANRLAQELNEVRSQLVGVLGAGVGVLVGGCCRCMHTQSVAL